MIVQSARTRDYLRAAYSKAAHSDDPHTHNGAILVDHNDLTIAFGCTRFPRGVKSTPERLVRPTKYQFIEHAERTAIYIAAFNGYRTEGATMYCPWFACHDCARAIVHAGVKQIIGHKQICDRTPEHWQASCAAGLAMFEDAGVEVGYYDGEIGGVQHLFDSQIWHP